MQQDMRKIAVLAVIMGSVMFGSLGVPIRYFQ